MKVVLFIMGLGVILGFLLPYILDK